MRSEKYENYLADLGALTKQEAREAIEDHMAARNTERESYACGYKMAYHHFVTLMQQQAHAFGIELQELSLHDIDEGEFLT